jgi:MATE family multidrug resistance protein
VGLPIGLAWLMEGGLFVATALVIGRLGDVPAAAHQIAINVCSLCFMVPMALAEATTVRVGHARGRGDRDGLRRAAFAGYVLDLLTQLVSGGDPAVRQRGHRRALHRPTSHVAGSRWPRPCC